MNKYKIKPTPFDVKPKQNSIFPSPLAWIIIGSSGCGKTTLLWNFITNDWVKYDHMYIFTKTLEQPIYTKLQEMFNPFDDFAYFFKNCEDVIPLEECEPNSLVVFDDCLFENQDIIKSYFTMGRHKNISRIYLTQSYSKVDLQVIRVNANFLSIFKQNKHYTKKIYDDFVGSDMTFDEFYNKCNECWKGKHGFITIDITSRRYMNCLTPNF